jgi:hypothetical protein
MRSRRPERLRRRGQIDAGQAHERERPERRRDGVAARAHREQVPLAHLGRIRRRGQRRGSAVTERRIAREHSARSVEHGRRANVDRERPKPRQRARRGQRRGAHATGRTAIVGPARFNACVTFTRIAWLVTVLACIVTGVALLVSGYQGYAAVFGAVGACAAINLR